MPVRQPDEDSVIGLPILAEIILQKIVVHSEEKDSSWLWAGLKNKRKPIIIQTQ